MPFRLPNGLSVTMACEPPRLNYNIIRNLPPLVASLIVVVISLTVCWLGDDIDYMFRIKTAIWDSNGFINTPSDFFQSQWNHYRFVNGRIVAHSLVQLFCGVWGKIPFALCNGIVWFLFLRLIGVCSLNQSTYGFNTALTITAVAMLSFVTKMMPTTQIGYVWMFTLTMLWWRLYDSRKFHSPVGIIFLCLLGLLAGNGQEALSVGMCAVLPVSLISPVLTNKVSLKEIMTSRKLLPVAFFIVGTAIDCLAPSTLNRAETAEPIGFLDSLLYGCVALRAFYLMLLVAIIVIVRKRMDFRSIIRSNAPCLTGIVVLLLFNFMIGIKSNRQLFGVELLSIIMLVRILPRHTFSRIPLLFLVLAALSLYAVQTVCAVRIGEKFKQIEREYLQSSNGNVYVTRRRVSDNTFSREFHLYEDITGQFDNDVRHSIMKLFLHTYPGGKVLRIMPEAVRPDPAKGKIPYGALRERVIHTAPGHYVIITSVENPEIVVTMRNRLTGEETPDTLRPPRPTSFVKVADGQRWNFYEFVPDIPFSVISRIDKFLLNSQPE